MLLTDVLLAPVPKSSIDVVFVLSMSMWNELHQFTLNVFTHTQFVRVLLRVWDLLEFTNDNV